MKDIHYKHDETSLMDDGEHFFSLDGLLFVWNFGLLFWFLFCCVIVMFFRDGIVYWI